MIFANPTDPNGPDLVDACRRATGRTYPDGYGFAIVYCDDAANATIQLHRAACALVAFAFSKPGVKKQLHKSSDVARFAVAMSELPNGGTIGLWTDADGKPVKLYRSILQHKDGTFEGGFKREEYPAPYGWLIEGCQLVIAGALNDDIPAKLRAECAAALKDAGHPGYR
jgi:hypothetical protein